MTRITAILLGALVVTALGCGDDRATGMGPDKPGLGPSLGDEFGAGDDESATDAPDSIGDDADAACAAVACGPGSECRMLPSTNGVPAPMCVPLACDESPPSTGACPQTCATGYAIADGAPTCGCCSLADEPAFRTCFDDKDCAAFERCDETFCETTCTPGLSCAAVCAGRCNAAALVPTW